MRTPENVYAYEIPFCKSLKMRTEKTANQNAFLICGFRVIDFAGVYFT